LTPTQANRHTHTHTEEYSTRTRPLTHVRAHLKWPFGCH